MAINSYRANPVSQTITSGVKNSCPSEDAVSTALVSKEDISNKVTDFSIVNDVLYPTTKAVVNLVSTLGQPKTISVNTSLTASYSLVMTGKIKINSGIKFTINTGATLRII